METWNQSFGASCKVRLIYILRNLLLATVSKRLSLCSAYMNEFPYNIEPRPSPSWLAAISLAANMVSSVECDCIFYGLLSNSLDLISIDDEQVQVVLKCIVPYVCSRAVVNRGLLRSDDLVKHGSLRLVFESVNLLCYVIKAINGMTESAKVKSEFHGSTKVIVKINYFPGLSYSTATDATVVDEVHQGDEMRVNRWISLREYIQDEVCGAMPDPQVNDESKEQDLDLKNDHAATLCRIWGLDKQDPKMKDARVVEDVFHSIA